MDNYEIFHNRYEGFSNTDAIYSGCTSGQGGCDEYKAAVDTLTELKSHIESQFKSGMTWENQGVGKGKWQIDHIIPCAKFDFTKRDQLVQCWHFRNLQPLWAKDNLIKGKK